MSYVTNVIAMYTVMPDEAKHNLLNEVNKQCPAGDLVSVRDDRLPLGWTGGTKFLQCEIAIGAFNYLNICDWIDNIRANVDFRRYQCEFFQFAIQEEDDERFKIIDVI